MDLLQQLQWRYATKEFDLSQKLSPEQWDMLQEVLRLSPSSYGLQPYKFVVVENPDLRSRLVEHSYGQKKVAESSHLIVLCRLEKMDAAHVERFVQLNASTRGVEVDSLEGFKQMLLGFSSGLSPETYAHWADKQVYLALGNLITACAVLGIDASPMEGFVPEKYDEILGLPAKGLRSVVICALGTRSPQDKYAQMKKVRFPREDLFVRL